MGPTCSIIYENEPLEKNTMLQAPKALTTTFFKWRELSISIVQGILIAIGTLSVYQYAVLKGYDEALTRTMTFLVLITANILLTLINRSFYYSILTTLSYKNRMIPFIIFTTIAIVSVMLSVPTITTFFEFETPSFSQFTICIIVGFVSVSWFEVAKWIQRRRK
jgi:Ca2+-transporting ATPase